MRILLDECIPRKFKHSLSGHDCRTVPEVGLAGKGNGDLLSEAEIHGFELFVTINKGLEYEQNMQGRRIAVILLLRSRVDDQRAAVVGTAVSASFTG